MLLSIFFWVGGQKAAKPLSDPPPKYKQLIVISSEVRNPNNITVIKVYRTIAINKQKKAEKEITFTFLSEQLISPM